VAVNSFFAGTLEGVRQTYLQTVLDGHSRHAWARFYTSKLPLTAVQILNNHVLPFVEKHRAKIATVLSDNGREFCGRPDRHLLRPSPPARGDMARDFTINSCMGPQYNDSRGPSNPAPTIHLQRSTVRTA